MIRVGACSFFEASSVFPPFLVGCDFCFAVEALRFVPLVCEVMATGTALESAWTRVDRLSDILKQCVASGDMEASVREENEG